MSEAITPTVQDYLGLVYLLQCDGESVIGARLAERLNVSRPTVAATLQRMERDGLIQFNERKEIALTAAGLDAAQDVLRRHTLAEWLLHVVIGLPWHQIHKEADRLEHYFSPEAVARLEAIFKNPEACPHGNPMPGAEVAPAIPLSEVAEGQSAVITRVVEEAEYQNELLAFLEENGLLPGVRVRVVSHRPYNETVTVEVSSAQPERPAARTVVLGLSTAQFIRVRQAGT